MTNLPQIEIKPHRELTQIKTPFSALADGAVFTAVTQGLPICNFYMKLKEGKVLDLSTLDIYSSFKDLNPTTIKTETHLCERWLVKLIVEKEVH